MILGFTGHRPNKLGGYKIPNPTYLFIINESINIIKSLQPEKCISGMALGFDQYMAEICVELKIPFIAAVPFLEQDKIWTEQAKKHYNALLDKASEVIIVSQGTFSAQKMQIRNEWIVDHSDALLCCWDGSKGGTYNCINYANNLKKDLYKINPINK